MLKSHAGQRWVSLKSTTEHTERTEPKNLFFSVTSVISVVPSTSPD
jgi:hypothetical protein